MPQFKFNTISRTDIEGSQGGSQMIRAIDYNGDNNLMITGCPGSGKTTVSLMRAERLINMDKRILVITFQDLLKTSLINIASPGLAPHIVTFNKWFARKFRFLHDNEDEKVMLELSKNWNGVDEIIIDEGQDFEARIFRTLLEKCSKITVGADNAQRVHLKGLKAERIRIEVEKKRKTLPINLQYNYRNTFKIYNFARYFLPFNERANNTLTIDRIPGGNGAIPVFFLVEDHNSRMAQLKILLDDAGERNVAVLVYKIAEVDFYHKEITKMGIKCSKHHSRNHLKGDIENVLITTFKSAKGLEFQVVIMPNMESVRDSHYKTEEHYYVACTRAKENLFLIARGAKLPVFFDSFSDSSYEMINVKANDLAVLQDEPLNLNDDLPF